MGGYPLNTAGRRGEGTATPILLGKPWGDQNHHAMQRKLGLMRLLIIMQNFILNTVMLDEFCPICILGKGNSPAMGPP